MKPYLLLLLGLITLDGNARNLLDDFSECRVKNRSACDAESDYAVKRINCYQQIIEEHKRCEQNVLSRISRERNVSYLKAKNVKDNVKKEAWSILEKKYEEEALEITSDLEKKKIDDIELARKFRSYNSFLSRQVIMATQGLRPRVSAHLKSAHDLNSLIGKSLQDFENKVRPFQEENKKLLENVERIIKNFESYFSYYQGEIDRTSQFDDNKAHYLNLMDESKNLIYEAYEMQRALLSLNQQFEAKATSLKSRSEDHQGIKRGEHLVTELFKARKELKNSAGEDKETLQAKVEFLTKYCLIEYQNNPQVCQEY